MKATVFPSAVTDSRLRIPPSKSLAHRAIICASLADGVSVVDNVDFSEDIKATIANMVKLGADIETDGDRLTIRGSRLEGLRDRVIDSNESGSTLRFMIPIFSLFGEEVKFIGSGRLMERPLNVYEKIYREQGLFFEQNRDGLITRGRLEAGTYEVEGNISSQFISGLLFTLPLLEADSLIVIRNEFESKSYVELTIDILKKFGIEVELNDDNTIRVKGGQKYLPADYTVEGDFSQLAFYAVLGSINSRLTVCGMNTGSLQGDREVIGIVRSMNAEVTETEDGYIFGKSELRGTVIDLANCPDLGPVLMVLAAFASGTTTIINAGRLRIKESDRIAAMETELRKMNVDISSDGGTVTIRESEVRVLDPNVDSHNDHRIVMAMSVLATVADREIVIDGAEAINKSYPGFFRDLRGLDVKVEDYE